MEYISQIASNIFSINIFYFKFLENLLLLTLQNILMCLLCVRKCFILDQIECFGMICLMQTCWVGFFFSKKTSNIIVVG